jgi:hypothetical protein
MDRGSELLEATPCPAITFQPGATSHFFETPEADRPLPSIENSDTSIVDARIRSLQQPRDFGTLVPASGNDDDDAADAKAKKLKSIFTFQKGINGKGQPFFTVSQVVAASGINFLDLPDFGGLSKARKIAETHFKEKAVLGALVLIDRKGGAHILKTATSANVGEGSEIMDTIQPSQLLWQPIWRKRVIEMGRMLKMKLGSIYDAAGAKGGCKPENYGRYHAAHVEKKLATFLVYMMLDDYDIKVTGKYATCENIRKLNRRIVSDPRGIRFELLVSRKWCEMCCGFVRRLSSASGIEIAIRVQPIVEPVLMTSREHKKYSRVKTSEDMDHDPGSVIEAFTRRRAQNQDAPDTAFTDEELQSFGNLELDAGEEDIPEGHRKTDSKTAESMQMNHNIDLPIRSGLSESGVLAQNEDGDDLFCPMYDETSKATAATEAEKKKGQTGIVPKTAALTIREEAELFGTPEVARTADVGSNGRSTLADGTDNGNSVFDMPPQLSYPSPEPMYNAGDEDDLFVPLNPGQKLPPLSSMQPSSMGPASPSPDSSPLSESPAEETPEPEVIDITETPPPPSAAQVAAFARDFAAPFTYQSQGAAAAAIAARPRKKPKCRATVRERVFQRKPLPATPVTMEPMGLRAGVSETPREEEQSIREYDFTGCNDPVFTQLEIERYG